MKSRLHPLIPFIAIATAAISLTGCAGSSGGNDSELTTAQRMFTPRITQVANTSQIAGLGSPRSGRAIGV
jgi:hypothetical protein